MPINPLDFLPLQVSEAILKIAEKVDIQHGRLLVVGGAVRDALFNIQAHEADLEVYGILPDALERLIGEHYAFDSVGKAFGVLKLKGIPLDMSLPRRESKQGMGHQGFKIYGDPFLSFEEAFKRRDFTMNAIGYDPLKAEWIDPYEGIKDLEKRVLKPVSEAFKEDPLRVLRGMQMIARFGLSVDSKTLMFAKEMTLEGLSSERIFEEWKKFLIKGIFLSQGLAFLKDSGWVNYFPELAALIGCLQDPVWHPEGDVWLHTGYALDSFAKTRIGDAWEDLVVGFAVLCHDMGKPLTTQVCVEGRIRSLGHDVAGEKPTRSFLGTMTAHQALIEQVIALVLCHMRPTELFKAKASDAAIRRLSTKVDRLDRLIRVVQADKGGRPPLSSDCPEGDWLLKRALDLKVLDAKPKPLLLGRDLINLGLTPSPKFSQLLSQAYEAQIEGIFHTHESGLTWIKNCL